MNRKSADVLMR